jgi:hypothetical protein
MSRHMGAAAKISVASHSFKRCAAFEQPLCVRRRSGELNSPGSLLSTVPRVRLLASDKPKRVVAPTSVPRRPDRNAVFPRESLQFHQTHTSVIHGQCKRRSCRVSGTPLREIDFGGEGRNPMSFWAQNAFMERSHYFLHPPHHLRHLAPRLQTSCFPRSPPVHPRYLNVTCFASPSRGAPANTCFRDSTVFHRFLLECYRHSGGRP